MSPGPGFARSRLEVSAALVAAAIAATACTAPDPLPEPPSPSLPWAAPQVTTTDPQGELITELAVFPAASSDGKQVLFSQRVDVSEGDVLLTIAEFQVTNDIGKHVFVASQVVLSREPAGVDGVALTPANGQNVTPDTHHGRQTKAGTTVATSADAGVRYVNLVAWAAMRTALPGDHLRVDRGYGKLSVLRW